MAIQNLGVTNLIPSSGVRTFAQAATLAAFLSGTGCAPSAPDQYEKTCDNFITQSNKVWGNRRLTGQEKRESMYRLAREFSGRFDSTSVEAEALQEVATIASNKIPYGPLGINGDQSLVLVVLASILFGMGVFPVATHFQKSEKERRDVPPAQKYGLPTILFLAAFLCSSAKCTHLLGDPTSVPEIKSLLTTKDCQDAWKAAHKNQRLGPGS